MTDNTFQKARESLQGFCHVCPTCDGGACAGDVPGMGGLGTGSSFAANIQALDDCRLNMRVLHDVTEPETRVNVLGMELSFPVLAAPIGGVSSNMGGRVSEESFVGAVIGGAVSGGIIGCTGDGGPDFIHEAGFEAIRKAGGKGIPFIKPWEELELFRKIEKAETLGVTAIGMDVDAAGLLALKQMGRSVSPKSPAKLARIIRHTPLKFVVKGIMTPDEARIAVEAGADAIVVSNHGGRVLDYTPGVAEVLPWIAEAVKGQATILADGGVRSGGDVLKMLALGADAVMIGRPFAIAAMGGGRSGVEEQVRQLKRELEQAMILTGTMRADSVSRSVLYGRR
ncbi:alpha-hydroxy-acid oxidizing protein [Desulfovibrio ferrophilus]|uniref:Protein LldD n=1 Tax=Desulfovibrio ferrophilus TaxID=241368 RepID=A0A2Z6B3J0_9BACT|nr:alpha-hydroxy-acid oxidizing protein [Desulfovibrio ferrophilus]BBD10023.1 protein LldD [Desulfovibrio ferrophilus]